ncbi:MAG: RNA polymerase sigma factor [Lacipirellulaceae bacterium]
MPATLAAAPKLRIAPVGTADGDPVQEGPSEESTAVQVDRAEDDRLIAATLAGQDRAFGDLVTKHQDRLRSTLARLTGSAEEAEDVAQEAFVQALLKLETFQRSARFYTWLYRIAFNLAVSKSRKRRPRVSLSAVQEAGGPEAVCAGPAPGRHAEAQERRELLHAAIAELADDHRQVLVLREFEGFDYQEIADTLGVPIGTVRSRLFRARLQLRELLAPTLGDDAE